MSQQKQNEEFFFQFDYTIQNCHHLTIYPIPIFYLTHTLTDFQSKYKNFHHFLYSATLLSLTVFQISVISLSLPFHLIFNVKYTFFLRHWIIPM